MRRILALSMLILGAVWAAPAQAADPTFRVTVSPDPVVHGEADRLTYRVEVTTGEEPERFTLDATPLGQFGGQGVLLFPTTDGMRLEGPGKLEPGPSLHGDPVPCHVSELPRGHGTFFRTQEYEVELEARTTSTVVFQAFIARHAPWRGDRYEMALRAYPDSARGGTLDRAYLLQTPAPRPAGRSGVRIDLEADTPASRECDAPKNDGRPVTLSGRTDPALAGQELVLRVVPPGARAATELSRVRVGGDGSFTAPQWRPKALGLYQVAAAYRSQDDRFTDEFSVPLAFELTAPVPDPPDPPGPPGPSILPPPRPHAVLVNRSLRADRDGLVRLRLWCPDRAGAPCANRIALAIGGRRTAASRSATVAPGARRTVRVRLSRADRRRVARRRDVPATVRIDELPRIAVTLRPRR